MIIKKVQQFCAICAWRENCAKKFCIPDGGAHCPDFTRDVSIKTDEQIEDTSKQDPQE